MGTVQQTAVLDVDLIVILHVWVHAMMHVIRHVRNHVTPIANRDVTVFVEVVVKGTAWDVLEIVKEDAPQHAQHHVLVVLDVPTVVQDAPDVINLVLPNVLQVVQMHVLQDVDQTVKVVTTNVHTHVVLVVPQTVEVAVLPNALAHVILQIQL